MPNQNPEQLARDQIDAQLLACGWVIQDKTKVNLSAALGIAWLKDQTLADLDNLPDPDVLALEIMENLEAGLERFRAVASGLGK